MPLNVLEWLSQSAVLKPNHIKHLYIDLKMTLTIYNNLPFTLTAKRGSSMQHGLNCLNHGVQNSETSKRTYL